MKFPIGIQTFREIIERGFVYVDKTPQLAALRDAGKYFFLARPRRFGKSLTVSTLAELYSGDRQIFQGTWAYDHWDFAARNSSLIWLQFASSGYGSSGLEYALHYMLNDNARRLGVQLSPADGDSKGTSARFLELIRAAAAASPSGKTVVLIDEYDKPITDFIARDDNMAQAEAHREQLRWFFSPLKDSDPYLELVFITGITAFSKGSLFSELNNLRNLSLDPLAHTLVGITQAELDSLFAEQLAATGIDAQRVREYYNGYAFGAGAERVYNPWSLFHFLAKGELSDDWYGSGTPYWLVRYMAEAGQVDVEGQVRSGGQLLNFDLRRLDTVALLYQTGYLTIAGQEPHSPRYTLRFPNLEVEAAFELSLLGAFLNSGEVQASNASWDIVRAMRERDLETVVKAINRTLAEVPYTLWHKHDERTFHLITHVLFRSVGVLLRSEATTARGRADAILETADGVYCFEFKVGASAEAAVKQILERGYLEAYTGDARSCIAVGINFDRDKRQVGEWLAQEID